MSTVADLKTRIADELSRDDMGAGGDAESALIRAIDSAVAYYAAEPFWFNQISSTVTTTGGVSTVAQPSGMRYPTQVSYLELPLRREQLETLEPLTETGLPTRWAMSGDLIYLWPMPDAAYSLSVQGVEDFATATFPLEHYDLIAARAKVILCRFPLRDADGLQLAMQEESEALARVNRESRKRSKVPLRSNDFPRRRYNINTDC